MYERQQKQNVLQVLKSNNYYSVGTLTRIRHLLARAERNIKFLPEQNPQKYNEVIGEISAQKIARQLGVVTIQQIMEDINLKVDQKIILDFKNVELSEKWIMINGKQYELYGYIKGLYRKDRLDADAMKDLGQ
ncbi:Hypothetical_protein [Hexamita inflata]|uniref:Hypothetical_protein n=1 Tax=Hexamita inflata TaxID=28002 RepID=A0AA86PSC4_9EUKA|nr:Hypothetical protein HINF_LOCUS27772 [Hexamita inflata]